MSAFFSEAPAPSHGPRPWLLALAAGLAQAASLAWPWGGQPLWWLQILSLALLGHVLLGAGGARRAAALGWLFATAWLAGTFWWLFISMHTYGGLAAPLAVLAVLALAAFLGSYYAAVSAYFWLVRPSGKALTAILFAFLWLLAELARGQWWTGFPWGAGGYAHVEGPLAVLARSVGVYGVGCVAAALAMGLAQWRARDLRRRSCWALLALLAAAWAGLAVQRHCAIEGCGAPAPAPVHAPLSLALLQGNIPQDEKFQPGSGVPMALQWYHDQLRSAEAALVVAPETAIPLLPQQLSPGYLDAVAERYTRAKGTQALLLGMPLGSLELGYTNSVLGFAPAEQQPYRYDKHHLVPFGEFIPPLFRWFTEMMNIPLGDFNRGAVGQPSLVWGGERIAPNICYEDLFGEELGARFRDAASSPTIMVNLSNIGWFGDTVAIDQHLAISRLRALEFERPMLRATNTGATAVIDHRGRVTHRLPAYQRGVLRAQVQGRGGAVTPYAWWVARLGLAPLWALGLAVAAAAWLLRRRR
ncbi:apolipoprotein N-acyltransferase [Alicycliphilus denitrificans]|uniref:apolipoprotein N-acyltransferase n=1 Tax=Alicycliphilus denitrificans TaxID=179636 RepID=UPI00384B5796